MERIAIRPTEFASAMGISRTSAYNLIRDGTVPSIRVGRSVRIPLESLRVWMKNTEQTLAKEDGGSNSIEATEDG
jgi:excisionase family DNA binding protein